MRHSLITVLIAGFGLLLPMSLLAQDKAQEEKAVRAVALDYIQGWYDADGARMERALHPNLAKRGLVGNGLQAVTAASLVNLAKNGTGKNSAGKKASEITVLDIMDSLASVKIISDQFIDYLHLGKVNGRWVIINVLWAYK